MPSQLLAKQQGLTYISVGHRPSLVSAYLSKVDSTNANPTRLDVTSLYRAEEHTLKKEKKKE